MRQDGQGTDERVPPWPPSRPTKSVNSLERDVIRLAVVCLVIAVTVYTVVYLTKQREFVTVYQESVANSQNSSGDPTGR